MEVAQESLNEVNNDAKLLKCVIIGDDTLVYGYDVKTKAQTSPSGDILDRQDRKKLNKFG